MERTAGESPSQLISSLEKQGLKTSVRQREREIRESSKQEAVCTKK